METVILVLHVVVSLTLIGLVVLQQGKGADMGAAFGSGASSTVFGASGSANFLSRSTAVLAAVFFVTNLSLAYFSGKGVARHSVVDSVMDTHKVEQPVAKPAAAPAQPASSDMPAVPTAKPKTMPAAQAAPSAAKKAEKAGAKEKAK